MHSGQRWIFFIPAWRVKHFRWIFLLFLENLQILPMGNVRHFRRIRENDAIFLKMCVFRRHLVNSLETLQILPMGNVRHFRRIHKNDTLFLKMCVFRENLLNSSENLQILPMGNVRHFRRIHENDTLFLKMCVFLWKFSEFVCFLLKNVRFSWNFLRKLVVFAET